MHLHQTTIFVQHAGGFRGRRTSDKMIMLGVLF